MLQNILLYRNGLRHRSSFGIVSGARTSQVEMRTFSVAQSQDSHSQFRTVGRDAACASDLSSPGRLLHMARPLVAGFAAACLLTAAWLFWADTVLHLPFSKHALRMNPSHWFWTPVTEGPLTMDPAFNTKAAPQERYFNWTISRNIRAPDGIPRLMYTINDVFPGPLIEANEGDTLVIHVRNAVLDNETLPEAPMSSQIDSVFPKGTERKLAMHWHGLSMRDSQVMDGAAGFSSCVLHPGDEYTYRFKLLPEDVGTHWYHSHVGTSRVDGLWGMLIVHARENEAALLQQHATNVSESLKWDEEVAIALGDHFHEQGPEFLARYVSRWMQKAEPVPASGLINGKHRFNCEHSRLTQVPCPADELGADEVGEFSTFTLDPSKRYRLRLVNVGALAEETFSVDGHTLTVIEADGVLVDPITVHRIPLAAGQRYSVLLNRVNETDLAWMRAEMSAECFQYMNPVLDLVTKAIVQYTEPSTVGGWLSPLRRAMHGRDLLAHFTSSQRQRRALQSKLPSTTGWSKEVVDPELPSEPCHDLESGVLVPLIPDPAPELHLDQGDVRETVLITVQTREQYGIVPMGFMNHTTWRAGGGGEHPRPPLLHRISHSNMTDASAWAKNDLVNDEHELVVSPHPNRPVVFELVINNHDDSEHPFHLHGHKFWVMETGEVDPFWGGYNDYVDRGQTYDLRRTMKRDTFVIPMMGHAVIRWVADNPGVWPFHCHMLVHLESGMAMAIAEQPALLQAAPPVPPTCPKM